MRSAIWGAVLAAGLAAVPPASAQSKGGMPRYEPTQRARTALDTCLKDEVMQGAYCVKKCQPDFRMEVSGKKAVCVGVKPDAKHVEVAPAWKPRSGPAPQGAQGY